jgi:hydrogenase small subunit
MQGPRHVPELPHIKWNGGTNWPIGCGHPCIGCSEPNFWDSMTPFYRHLPGAPGFGVASDIDKIGMMAVAGVGAAFAAHGLIQIVKRVGENRYAPVTPPVKEEGDR